MEQSQLSKSFIYLCVVLVLSAIGEQILLPLFLGSLGGSNGQYFVLIWVPLICNIIYWLIVLYRVKKGIIKKEMKIYNKHWKFILIGFFDALSNLLLVFSSSLDRTPGVIQSMLIQTSIPFSILFSKIFLKKKYKFDQIFAAILTCFGVLVSLIPIFNDFNIGSNQIKFQWPVIYLMAIIPIVLYNIVFESIFIDKPDIDLIYILAWETLYEEIIVLFLFWTDIIPGFGTNDDLNMFGEKMKFSFTCFWNPWNSNSNKCNYCFLIGTFYIISYIFIYINEASVMKRASANLNVIVLALPTGFVMIFWFIFPGLNRWAGGNDYSKLDLICYIIAIFIIILAIIIYRRSEKTVIEDINEEVRNNENYSSLIIGE